MHQFLVSDMRQKPCTCLSLYGPADETLKVSCLCFVFLSRQSSRKWRHRADQLTTVPPPDERVQGGGGGGGGGGGRGGGGRGGGGGGWDQDLTHLTQMTDSSLGNVEMTFLWRAIFSWNWSSGWRVGTGTKRPTCYWTVSVGVQDISEEFTGPGFTAVMNSCVVSAGRGDVMQSARCMLFVTFGQRGNIKAETCICSVLEDVSCLCRRCLSFESNAK